MSEHDHKIAELEARLDSLVRTQIGFQTEITAIRKELSRLRNAAATTRLDTPTHQPAISRDLTAEAPPTAPTAQGPPGPPRPMAAPTFGMADGPRSYETERKTNVFSDYVNQYNENAKANLEKFIGENLISKVGIVVLVVGIGIGAKYAIDNGWISPLMRTILGYLAGVALLGVGARLKPKYHNFSAVLMSGGMAVMYFITYFAYAAYQLISQPSAFAVMVLFTAFTIASALLYNRQVIAHIGLVGAYAVPFLLSDNSGNYLFLFAYMAILNAGILAISVKKAWKAIFYSASAFTWLIFGAWFLAKYNAETHFYLALAFAAIFFGIFYATRIVHGVLHGETNGMESVVSTIGTAVIFYIFCMGIGDVAASPTAYAIYFGLLAVMALAILLTSYKFYGRMLVFVAYPFTWLIFASWFFKYYDEGRHFFLATSFAAVFFLIFYCATLIYRLVTDELSMAENAGLVLTNSFIFYWFGYGIMDSRAELQQFEGLFTASHGIFHSLVAHAVDRFKAEAIDVVQVLAVLIVTFTTLAIPIQFDGNVVTLVWTIEGAVLFYFARARGVRLFEYLSYPVMALAALAMVSDWINVYSDRSAGAGTDLLRRPFANGDLVTGLVFTAAAAFIYFINRKHAKETVFDQPDVVRLFGRIVAAAGLLAFYNTFRMELGNYFYLVAGQRDLPRAHLLLGNDVGRFNGVAQIDYTMLFLTVMGFVNLRKVRSVLVGCANIGLAVLLIGILSTAGMFFLHALRSSYLHGEAAGLFGFPAANVAARYVTFAFTAGLFVVLYEYSRNDLLDGSVRRDWRSIAFDALLYPAVLVVASCELMNIAAHLHVNDADRFGLTILWGVFALVVVAIGIAFAKKHLRIGAIVLVAITLVKLFIYDITDLGTIPKTILFISLGLLFLVISFLYNKYKSVIFGSEAETEEES